MHSPNATPVGSAGFEPSALHPDLRMLVGRGVPSAEDVARFLAGHEFPLTEPGAATFVWQGAADRVELLRWIHGGVDRTPFLTLPGTGLWVLRMPVQGNGRFEYKLNVQQGDHEDWMLDPLNPPVRATRSARVSSAGPRGTTARNGANRPVRQRHIERIKVDSPTFGETRPERIDPPHGYTPNPTTC